jgi:WD40 repeat protein
VVRSFSSNGRIDVASGSTNKTIRLWDVASRSCTATRTGHSSFVLSVAFCSKLRVFLMVVYLV